MMAPAGAAAVSRPSSSRAAAPNTVAAAAERGAAPAAAAPSAAHASACAAYPSQLAGLPARARPQDAERLPDLAAPAASGPCDGGCAGALADAGSRGAQAGALSGGAALAGATAAGGADAGLSGTDSERTQACAAAAAAVPNPGPACAGASTSGSGDGSVTALRRLSATLVRAPAEHIVLLSAALRLEAAPQTSLWAPQGTDALEGSVQPGRDAGEAAAAPLPNDRRRPAAAAGDCAVAFAQEAAMTCRASAAGRSLQNAAPSAACPAAAPPAPRAAPRPRGPAARSAAGALRGAGSGADSSAAASSAHPAGLGRPSPPADSPDKDESADPPHVSAWLEAPDAGAPSDPLNEAAASEAVASSSQSCTDGALARRAARRRGLARRGRPPGLRAAAAGLSGDSGSAARSAGDSSEKKLPALLLRRREPRALRELPRGWMTLGLQQTLALTSSRT